MTTSTCTVCAGTITTLAAITPTVTDVAEPEYCYDPTVSDPAHQETIFMSQLVTYRRSWLSCTIQSVTVDTGATISAIEAALVEKLGSEMDILKYTASTTPNNYSTS